MALGTILSLPSEYSIFARVRSEHGEEYTVHGTEIPTSLDEGDNYAYHVDIFQNQSGDAVTLRSGSYTRRKS